MFFDPATDILLISAGFVTLSQAMQTFLMDRKKVRHNQKKMKEIQKKQQELMRQSGNADPKEMERVQQEMMQLTAESMKQLPKVMIGSLIIFAPLFGWVQHAYNGTTINLFFPFNLIWPQTDWFWFYMLCSMIISLCVSKAFTLYEDHREKKQNTTLSTPRSIAASITF